MSAACDALPTNSLFGLLLRDDEQERGAARPRTILSGCGFLDFAFAGMTVLWLRLVNHPARHRFWYTRGGGEAKR